jgi:L-rhamnose-proton symport protein (RhaT).
MEVVNGVLFHAIGASSASLCYTPEKKVKGWSWQTYWLAQAFVCWLLLPLLVAVITIPDLMLVLKEAPHLHPCGNRICWVWVMVWAVLLLAWPSDMLGSL